MTEIICMDVHLPHAEQTRIVMVLNAEMGYVLMNSPREVIKLVYLNFFLFFRILEPSGSACDKHSDCLPSTLCANNKCETTQRVGSFGLF